MNAFTLDSEFKTNESLEDYIHDCMLDHANIIKKNYKIFLYTKSIL